MRQRIFLFALGLLVLAAAAPAPAEAHWRRYGDGYDPYAYRYEPRGYYPYYNSGYWVPAWVLRKRYACCKPVLVLPPYYEAWGYPKRHKVRRARYYQRHW
jgi:hypothetical protein